MAQMGKSLSAMQETQVRLLGQEDYPGERNGNPFQYSCLENPMDRGAWRPTVHGVAKSWTQLSDLCRDSLREISNRFLSKETGIYES